MKFTCLKENFAKNLSIVSKAVPIKHSLPVLSNVLISTHDGRLKLSGTDLDTAITVYVGASIELEGSITVPARLLSEFISHLSTDTVLGHLEEDVFHLTAGTTKSKFNGVSADDFPQLPEINPDLPYIEFDPKLFGAAVSQVGFAVANDDSRLVFTGILLQIEGDELTIVGSDGFRLSEKKLSITNNSIGDFSVILPAKTLSEISRIFSSNDEAVKMFLNENENLCLFEFGDIVVASRIIEGAYPDYKRIIPVENNCSFEFSSHDLLEAVKLTNVFAKDSNNTLKLILETSGILKITSSSQETGENNSEISIKVLTELNENFEIVFNAKYLLDFLTNNKHETLVFSANDNKSPCIIKPSETQGSLYVMAPLHING